MPDPQFVVGSEGHDRRSRRLRCTAAGLVLVAFLGSGIECPAWDGKVVDRQDRKPVDGAVAVRRWDEYTVTPIAGGRMAKGAVDGLSDREGRFSVPWLPHWPINPFVPFAFSWVREMPPVVYRAGYDLYVAKEAPGPKTVELDRIVSSRGERKRIVEAARVVSGLSFLHEPADRARLKQLVAALASEEEFLGLPSPGEAPPFPVPYWAPAPAGAVRPRSGGAVVLRVGESKRTGVGLADSTPKEERTPPAVRPGDTVESLRASLSDPGRNLDERADAACRLGAASRDPGDAERLAGLLFDLPPLDVGARQGLERMGGIAVEPLIRILRGERSGPAARSDRARFLAAKAAETVRDPRLKKEAMRLLGEGPGDGFVAESLARGLGNYGDAETAEALVRAVLAERRGKRREESYRSLIRIGSPAVRPLSAALGQAAPELRVEAIYCLMKIGDRDSVPALIGRLTDRDPDVRWAARCALASIGEPSGAIPQIESWKSRDAGVRREATLGILKMGRSAQEPLVDALRDPEPGIRWRAAWCLGWIGDPASAAPLGLLKHDGNRDVRWLGAEALARNGKGASVESLRGFCSETDPGIRRIAHDALAASGREGCPSSK